MPLLGYIVIFSLIGSVAALSGGLFLITREDLAKRLSWLLVSFAAGALLAVSFFDLLPEALGGPGADPRTILSFTLGGLIIFFLLERFLLWHHAHHGEEPEIHPYTKLLAIGDAFHNFVDGVAITAAFLFSIPLGITTALSVFAHEVPQEVGDFGVMLHGGMKKKVVVLLNLAVALTTPFAALLTFFVREQIFPLTPAILAFAAGSFLYIAGVDLIPQIHRSRPETSRSATLLAFFLGIILIWLLGKSIPA